MKRQSIDGSEVLSIDIELVSSVDVLRTSSDLNNTVTSVIQSKIGGEINHKENM